ncbi:MAG: methyltransferase domain-containing protein, partial [Myxococcales bacterium]|nr:methyltransferase domain-containing protein [Myxococcales bacterium]
MVSFGAPDRGVDFVNVVSTSFKRLGQSELLPRYIFAESLYARRRVLEIGAVASTLGQSARFLSTRGARVVVAADSDLQAIQEAQAKLAGPNLRFRPPVFDDFEAGSFDLVMVADLAPYVVAPELLKDLARLVAKGGYLMGGLRNPAGLALSNVIDPEEATPTPTYGQLLDALTVHFKSVEVATQSPVLGYQLAFERGEGLQVDGSLAGISEAAYFIVVAGQEPARSFDPTWVQLPPEPLAFTGGRLEDFSSRARDWRERSERMKDALQKKTVELETRQADLRETSGQLEATKDAVARLTAQLESHRDRPEALRDREDLAQRVRRMEAELTVLRERAIDAEGRATAARSDHDVLQRAQKDAAITTLAAQEQIRLERARREEVATQLEDARTRLARAYEELKKAQEDVVTERLERERALSAADRVRETMSSKEADLESARQRELALADARTQSLLAIEGLERSLAEARTQVAAMRDESQKREADRLSLSRSFEVESTHRRDLEKELQREVTKARELEQALAEKQTALTGIETELQSAASAHARALRDIETLASSERTWRELAGQYEQRLVETSANVQQLSDQVAQLGAEKESEIARGRRLERDLETAITAERTSREQADVLGGDLRRQITEISQDRERLIEERDDLRGAVDDLRKARESEQQRVAQLEDRKAELTATVSKLEAEVAQARRQHEELVQSAAQQQRTLQGVIVDRDAALATEKATSAALRQQIVGLDGEIARLGGMLREGQKRLDDTRASLEARSKDVEVEQADAAAVRKRIQLLEGTLGQATDALEQTAATLDATRAEKAALQHRLDESTLRTTGLSDQVQNLQRITLAADEALAAAKSQRNALDRELAALREQTEVERKEAEHRAQSLRQTAEVSAGRVVELEARFAEASTQLREQGERAAQQQAELERQTREQAERAAQHQAELERQTERAAQHQSELERLAREQAEREAELQGELERLTR